MRIGFGYDVHPLKEGEKMILGGVEITHKKGLVGHSDADALCHAIIDAMFGAAALGDIGTHFPDSDEKYRGISSLKLLEQSAAILLENNYRIINIDSTIVLEKPKLISYKQRMIKNISEKLDIKTTQISVKATKEEGLGFVGEQNGIKVFAVVLLEKKNK
ncbi:MAG: 2-C-methyl-D-erythritol 2,4-cyclodiphosphate synthase [Candidatus Cloacimonadota bacterium]|nr:2-C-methyl-D-erythritol 2,4-cyclodiphosphate synthase [Candidatus Cloacimonadota bacterium]